MEDIPSPKCGGNDKFTEREVKELLSPTHMKNRIQLIKKLLSFRLRYEGFGEVWVEMELLHLGLFPLQLFWFKKKILNQTLPEHRMKTQRKNSLCQYQKKPQVRPPTLSLLTIN